MTQAKFKDLQYANTIISIAQKAKDVGITYRLKRFKFEEAVVVGMQDASFANDHELNEAGKRLGFRSQSGRLLCLGPPGFKDTKQGELLLVSWHSVTIKCVCRSTLQAESMSLIAGLRRANTCVWFYMDFVVNTIDTMANGGDGRGQRGALHSLQEPCGAREPTNCASRDWR